MRATERTVTLAAGANTITLDAAPRPAHTYPAVLWLYVDLDSSTTVVVELRVGGSAAARDNIELANTTGQHIYVPCRPVPLDTNNIAATLRITVGDAGIARLAWADSEDNR